MNKRVTTRVTSAKGNQGLHSVRHYKSAKRMLETHPYHSAQLFHLCFTGSTQVAPYKAAIKSMVEHLRDRKMPCQYRAALEQSEDPESNNLHMHVFLLVEAKWAMPVGILNRKDDGWLKIMSKKKGIDFYINHPRDPLHLSRKGDLKLYATLPPGKPAKLANCIDWVSYLYKQRSKPKLRQIYFSSKPSREKLLDLSQRESPASGI